MAATKIGAMSFKASHESKMLRWLFVGGAEVAIAGSGRHESGRLR